MSLHSLRELKLTKAVALYNRDQQPEYQSEENSTQAIQCLHLFQWLQNNFSL